MQKIKILLADDDPILRRLLPKQIPASDFEFETVGTGNELLEFLASNSVDAVLLDINLPDISGLDLIAKIRETHDAPQVLMLTADTNLKTGIEAMRRGAYEYITKPANAEQVEAVIRKAVEKGELIQQNARLLVAVRQQTNDSTITPVHESAEMKRIFAQAELVAKTDTTLLITGESGTGKDVLARWAHAASPRSKHPLISVNCGALPENLFESEFFGHEKGSFTGASGQKIGLIEAADGSTLFLDEIGDMPLSMQVKLLHFLENGSFRRVGATKDNAVDVRVIAATNRPLEDDVNEGKFRADLYYRLNIVSFHIPPLRERRSDIPALVEFFLEKFRQKFHRPDLRLSEGARMEIENHRWSGNIRELRNTLERAVVLSPNDLISEIFGSGQNERKIENQKQAKPNSVLLPLAEVEKRHIQHVLEQVNGKREKAAAILGITARTLYRKLNEFETDDR